MAVYDKGDYTTPLSNVIAVKVVPAGSSTNSLNYNITSDHGVGTVSLKVGDAIKFTATIGQNTAGWTGSKELDIVGANTEALSCQQTSYTSTQALRVCTATQNAGNASDSQMAVYAKGDTVTPLSNAITVKVGSGSTITPSMTAPSNDEGAINEQEIAEGQPDLTISVAKATLVLRTFRDGTKKKQYKIGVTVKNVGDGDADGPIYFSYANSANSVSVLVANDILESGKMRKIFVYVDSTEKGKSYTFTVDPGNTVDESNEDNNTATRVVGK
jgi:subtilase family serine protease